jgi:hypothetical protein
VWRRRKSQQPVVLPSLDRLSGLIERVVELVEAVGDTKEAPGPAPAAEPPRAAPAQEPTAGWLAFLGDAHGYRLVEGPGPLPALGATIELGGGRHEVVKIGRSPLPGDARACAFLVGEEPQAGDRNPDA